jgi:hypothetical protein
MKTESVIQRQANPLTCIIFLSCLISFATFLELIFLPSLQAQTIDDLINPEEALKKCTYELIKKQKILDAVDYTEKNMRNLCGSPSVAICEERRENWKKWLTYNQEKLREFEIGYKVKYDQYVAAEKSCATSWSVPGVTSYWCQKKDKYLTELNEMIEYMKSLRNSIKSNQDVIQKIDEEVKFIKEYGNSEDLKPKVKNIKEECERLRLVVQYERGKPSAVQSPGPEPSPSVQSASPSSSSSPRPTSPGSKYEKYLRPMTCERACQTGCSFQQNDPGCVERCLKERCSK